MKKYILLFLMVVFLCISTVGMSSETLTVEKIKEYNKTELTTIHQYQISNITNMSLDVEIWLMLGKEDNTGKIKGVKQILVRTDMFHFKPGETINIDVEIENDIDFDYYQFRFLLKNETKGKYDV